MLNDKLILDEFGQLLINKVRDACYDEFEKIFSGKISSKSASFLQEKIKIFDDEQLESLKFIAIDSIDSAIHHFLWMIEQSEEFDLVKYLHNKNGFVSLKETSDGLCGELYTENGWIEKYSTFSKSTI